MKTKLYLRPSGNYYDYSSPEGIEVSARFIHTKSIGDYNKLTYSSTKKKSTKSESREQVFFICEEGKEADREHQAKIDREFKRGETFFTQREGFLFGAYHELTKLGKIVKIPV